MLVAFTENRNLEEGQAGRGDAESSQAAHRESTGAGKPEDLSTINGSNS